MRKTEFAGVIPTLEQAHQLADFAVAKPRGKKPPKLAPGSAKYFTESASVSSLPEPYSGFNLDIMRMGGLSKRQVREWRETGVEPKWNPPPVDPNWTPEMQADLDAFEAKEAQRKRRQRHHA